MPAFHWTTSMVSLFRITAPALRRLVCIAALLLAVPAAIAADNAGTAPPGQAERFVASLPGMLAIIEEIPDYAPTLERGDDPIQPFETLPPGRELRGRIDSHLSDHGFASLADWRGVGRPLMDAYWALRARGRMAMLAEQMAPLALAVRGNDHPSWREIADMSDRLYDQMEERNAARVPADDMALATKYEARIRQALDVKKETGK